MNRIDEDLSLNNKFGKCCGCPALMSDKGRMFTNYVSSRLYNTNLSKNMKTPDSNAYRLKLQKDQEDIASQELAKLETAKCTSNKQNKFYIDSSKYTFDKPLSDPYWGYQIINDGTLKKSKP